MRANSSIRVRINEDIKQQAKAVLEDVGLSISDAVSMLLTRTAKEKHLPFKPMQPNKTTLAAMQELDNKDKETFNSVEDLMADLHDGNTPILSSV